MKIDLSKILYTSFFLLLIALLISSCGKKNKRIEKVEKIPESFHGEWIHDFEEIKMIITDNEILIYDISIPEEHNNFKKDEIIKMHTIERGDCNDCLGYGLEVSFENFIGKISKFYLEGYQPRLNKFLIMRELESIMNYDNERENSQINIWKRNDL